MDAAPVDEVQQMITHQKERTFAVGSLIISAICASLNQLL